MKKVLWLALVFAGLASSVRAQEFGAEAPAAAPAPVTAPAVAPAPVAEVVDGSGAQALKQAVETEDGGAITDPAMFLEKMMLDKGWNKGYDEEKNRIIVMQTVKFDIDDPNNITNDFIKLRSFKMNELLLRAKGQIIQEIFTKMSAERILDIPGNPVKEKVNLELAKAQDDLNAAIAKLQKMNEDFETARKQNDSHSFWEKLQFVSKWFEKTTAADYIANLTADKKASYEEAKVKLANAKEVYETALAKAEEVKNTLAEECKNEVSANSAMVIQGCTILKQIEGTVEEEGATKFQISAIYCWSNDMQMASGEILQGRSVKFAPGKKSIQQWIIEKAENGALATWVGPRNFIDNKGNMWFIGISCAPNHKNSSIARSYLTQASLKARSEVAFALFADAMAKQVMEETMKSYNKLNIETGDVKTTQEIIASTAEHFAEKIKADITGLTPLFSNIVTHPNSQQKIQVCVYGLDAGNVANLKKIQAASTALGIQINTAQEMERGRQTQMRERYERSKDNQAARAAGAIQADNEINAQRQGIQQKNGFRPAAGGDNQNNQNKPTKLKKGVNFVDDDDDF